MNLDRINLILDACDRLRELLEKKEKDYADLHEDHLKLYFKLAEARLVVLLLKKQLVENGLKPEYEDYDEKDMYKALNLELDDILEGE